MRKRSRIIASVFCLTALFPFLLMNGCLEDDVTSDPSSASLIRLFQLRIHPVQRLNLFRRLIRHLRPKSLLHRRMPTRIRDAGEIVVSGTAGKYDRQQSQPLTSETMYGVASCSKVAATAL